MNGSLQRLAFCILAMVLLVALTDRGIAPQIRAAANQDPGAQKETSILKGVVRSKDGTPLAGARVAVFDEHDSVVAQTLSGEDGRFAFSDLMPVGMNFKLKVSRTGFFAKVFEIRFGPQGWTAPAEFALEENTSIEAFQIWTMSADKAMAQAPESSRPSADDRPAAARRPDAAAPKRARPPAAAARDRAPSAAAAPPLEFEMVSVYFATDRQKFPEELVGTRFGSNLANPHELSYGICYVAVPRDRLPGSTTNRSFWEKWLPPDPRKDVLLVDIQHQEKDPFFLEISGRVARSQEKEAFVFIHGFNVSFKDAAERAGQLAYDLGFEGAPILYSWPSAGGMKDYVRDSDAVMSTEDHLKEFLEDVSTRTGAQKISLIAHSMGNRALTRVLQRIADTRSISPLPRFHQIVLAAPDIARVNFPQFVAALRGTGERITLYASREDFALQASKRLHQFPRVGDADPEPVVIPGFDTVDASCAKGDVLGHSYFASSADVLMDILKLLR